MGKTILGVMRKYNYTGYLKYTDRRFYMFEIQHNFSSNYKMGKTILEVMRKYNYTG